MKNLIRVICLIILASSVSADSVLLPGRYAEVFARKRGRVIERLNQLVQDPARCAVILAAAGLDVSVCK